MNIKEMIEKMVQEAKKSARQLASLNSAVKNRGLVLMAENLERKKSFLQEENSKDVDKGKKKGLSDAMVDRLILNDDRIGAMAQGLREVAALPDPVGEVMRMWKRPNDLQIGKVRAPDARFAAYQVRKLHYSK